MKKLRYSELFAFEATNVPSLDPRFFAFLDFAAETASLNEDWRFAVAARAGAAAPAAIAPGFSPVAG